MFKKTQAEQDDESAYTSLSVEDFNKIRAEERQRLLDEYDKGFAAGFKIWGRGSKNARS